MRSGAASVRRRDPATPASSLASSPNRGEILDGQRLLAGLLDRAQRGIARLVDAGLDRQQRGRAHAEDLDKPALELAFDGRGPTCGVVVETLDDRDVREVEEPGERDPRGAVDRIGRLHAAEHEICPLALHRRREHARHRERIRSLERIVPDPHAAIGSLRQGAQQDLACFTISDGDRNDLAFTRGLPQRKRLLERERVPLVELPLQEVRIDRGATIDELELVVERRHRLHRYDDLHLG